ncbi:MAG: C40 family peptidase [Bacteroidales bacterium]|nr:C40 family peptidase [Bacteroidales bacterium]
MKRSFLHPILSLITVLVLALSMASCHSSKRSVDPYADYTPEATTAQGTISGAQQAAIVKEARRWLGTKYRYGGHSRKDGTDCSGMVMEIYDQVCKVKLPRSSREQQAFCKGINRKDLKVGDLVFFCTSKDAKKVSHVGIYIGNGKIIHSSASKGVVESSIDEPYYIRTYHSSGRVPTK